MSKKKREYTITVELKIEATSLNGAISKAWQAAQYGYQETAAIVPPKGLISVTIDDCEVRT